jgi:hypothetical protein
MVTRQFKPGDLITENLHGRIQRGYYPTPQNWFWQDNHIAYLIYPQPTGKCESDNCDQCI